VKAAQSPNSSAFCSNGHAGVLRIGRPQPLVYSTVWWRLRTRIGIRVGRLAKAKEQMGKPATRQIDGTMIAASASVATLLLCVEGSANARGSQSFYLNTFASLQQTHAPPLRTGHRRETSSLRRTLRLRQKPMWNRSVQCWCCDSCRRQLNR
jgi:hypothetical protein